MDEHEELLGADYAEHNIHHPDVGVTRGAIQSGLNYHIYEFELFGVS